MDSLRDSLSNGSRGVTGTGGLFWQEYFKVFPKSLKNWSSKYGRSKGWKPSSESFGSGEGLSKDAMGSASDKETSSWLGLGSTWRGSSGGVFSRMRSKRASPSTVVLWVNKPLAAISSYRADSLLSPNQKCCKSTWLGIDKSGPDLVKIENLSQAAPMVSFSFCWKLSISCRRAAIRDIGKNVRHNLFLSSS